MVNVPMLNPIKGNEEFQQDLEDAALRVLRSGQYILGSEVEKFEQECAEYLGVKYAIGVSSGTDALLATLMALDVGPGDEVICPAFTFFATAGSIARLGATPVFVDVCSADFNVTTTDIEMAITPRTRAILPVHLFGQTADMDEINKIAACYNLPVVEDACQAVGAKTMKGEFAGSLGTAGCFSFFPSKNLGGFGDGGLITTNDLDLRDRILRLRNHGGRDRYIHEEVGGNFRLDALQAALLSVKLKHLDTMLIHRKLNALRYKKELENVVNTTPFRLRLPKNTTTGHSWNQYTVIIDDTEQRTRLAMYLAKKGIGFGTYYPRPLHKQTCFKSTCHLPVTDWLAPRVLSLPIAAEVTPQEISLVCEVIEEFFEGENR